MRKDILAFIGLIAILAVLVGGIASPFMITGYDGIEATVSRAEHGYTYYDEDIGLTGYGFDPYIPSIVKLHAETGLKIEIGQPRQTETRLDWSDSISVIDEVEGTNTTTIWEAHIVYLTMGATIATYGNGILTINDVDFMIRLVENPYSYFTGVDEAEAFIVAVSTTAPVSISGDIDVTPTASGYGFPLTTVTDYNVPSWILQSGYTESLGAGKDVEFKLRCLDATPSNFFGLFRTEATATFTIQVEVLLFGQWEVVQEYIEWEYPVPEMPIDLITFLTLFAWVILGFAATILIFRFVPDIKMKLIATGLVWAILVAIYGINAIQVLLQGAG